MSLAADVHDLGNGSYQVSYALPHMPVAGGTYDIQVAYLGVPMAQTPSASPAGTQRRARRRRGLSSSTCVNLRAYVVDTRGATRQDGSEQGTEESNAEGECAVEVASRRQRGYWVGGEWRPFCVWPHFSAEVSCCCLLLVLVDLCQRETETQTEKRGQKQTDLASDLPDPPSSPSSVCLTALPQPDCASLTPSLPVPESLLSLSRVFLLQDISEAHCQPFPYS